MSLRVSDIYFLLDELAPFSLACGWDNCGLQAGGMDEEVKAIMICLDVTSESVEEAVKKKADLIVSHHPLIFKPLPAVLSGTTLDLVVKNGLNLISAHTNLDKAKGGVSDILAEKIGLVGCEPLAPEAYPDRLKLVTFVPREKISEVMQALFDAGAGLQGDYSACSFGISGIGTFFADEDSSPYLGEKGGFNKVEEVRLETVLDGKQKEEVLKALLSVHPYEEPVIDLYHLEPGLTETGLGRIGRLEKPLKAGKLLEDIKKIIEEPVEFYGDPERKISRAAVCAGKGDELLETAAEKGAELFLSGDIGYHSILKARELGVCLIDAGHRGTEIFIVDQLRVYFEGMLGLAGAKVKVFTYK